MKLSRPQKEVQKIKDAILDDALNIIVAEGFQALTMRRLAKAAGMTAPNLYNYFPGKDEIYITLMINGFQKLNAALAAELERYSDPVQSSRAMMLAYLKFGREDSPYYEIMFSAGTPKYQDYLGTSHEALSTQEHRVSMELAELAIKVIQNLAVSLSKPMSDAKARLTLTAVWSLLHGMVSLRNSHNVEYLLEDTESVYQQIIDVLMQQIEALL
jgi:AcrR family transcriptional regulator